MNEGGVEVITELGASEQPRAQHGSAPPSQEVGKAQLQHGDTADLLTATRAAIKGGGVSVAAGAEAFLVNQIGEETPPTLDREFSSATAAERKLVARAVRQHFKDNKRLKDYYDKLPDGDEKNSIVAQLEKNRMRELDYGAIRAKAFDSFGRYYQDAKAGKIDDLKFAIRFLQGVSLVVSHPLKAIAKRFDAEAEHVIQVDILERRAQVEVMQAAIQAAQNDFGLAHKIGLEVIKETVKERDELQKWRAWSESHGLSGSEENSQRLKKLDLRESYARNPSSMSEKPYPGDPPSAKGNFVLKMVSKYL